MREAWLGLVIVGAIVVAVVGTLWLEGSSFGQSQRDMEAVFEEVGLIRPGNPIKLRGVEVGRVQEVSVDSGGAVVRLSFRVDEDLVLPEDAVVILSPESMFGDWQAEIVPRSRFPAVAYAQPWEPGVLPGGALPDISELTHTADQIAVNLGVLTDRMGIAFSDETARNVASMIDNIEAVTQRLSALVTQQADSFTGVTERVQMAVDGIGSAADQATATLERVDELLAQDDVASTLEDMAVIAANMRDLSGDLQGTNAEIRQTAARADSAFARADAILTRMAAGEGTMGRVLENEGIADDLQATVVELKVLLTDIRENPRRYFSLSIF